MNKLDLDGVPPRGIEAFDTVAISALKRDGLDRLLDSAARFFLGLRQEVQVTIPATRGDLIAMARRDGQVLSEEYLDGSVRMRALVTAPVAGRLRKAAAVQ